MSAIPGQYLPGNIGSPVTPVQPSGGSIQGNLPMNAANVGGMFTGDIAGSYQSAYNTALGQNQANYNNILSGYQKTLQQQQGAQQAIAGGYNQLYNNVLSGIQGIGQSQAQAIADAYAQQQGSNQQDLINRGLGNSTVLSSVQRGLGLDQQKANIALANQIAQLNAGYQSSLGMAGLNYANQAAMQTAAQQNQQLNWMNSIQAQYPDVNAYSNLYMQQGAMQQANANRAQAADQFNRLMSASQMARGAAGGMGGIAQRGGANPYLPGSLPSGSGAGGGLASITPFGLGGPADTAVNPYAGIPANPNFSTAYNAALAGTQGATAGALGAAGYGGATGATQAAPWELAGAAAAASAAPMALASDYMGGE